MGVAEQIVALGKKKSFLREFCASVVCQLLSVCPEGVCRDHVIHRLELDAGWKQCTTEKLQVLLHLSTIYSKVPLPPSLTLAPTLAPLNLVSVW